MSFKGISLFDIDFIIITHSDFDHVGGLKHFKHSKKNSPKATFELWTNETSRLILKKWESLFMISIKHFDILVSELLKNIYLILMILLLMMR